MQTTGNKKVKKNQPLKNSNQKIVESHRFLREILQYKQIYVCNVYFWEIKKET